MIVDGPKTATDQLHGALRALLPAELTASTGVENHDDHLDLSDCCSEACCSDERTPPGKHQQPVLAKTQLGIAQAVRIFGGVIIGTGAEEISRSWGQLSDRTAAFSAQDSGGESDPGYEPFVESFDLSEPSLDKVTQESSFPSPESSPGQEGGGRACGDTSTLPERPVGGLKRKFHTFVENSPPGVGDATPRAPGGLAAARAKAAGQGRTSFVSECSLPTDKGGFKLRAYRYLGSDKSHEPVVMVAGKVRGREGVPVRVHDQCQTSEVRGMGNGVHGIHTWYAFGWVRDSGDALGKGVCTLSRRSLRMCSLLCAVVLLRCFAAVTGRSSSSA